MKKCSIVFQFLLIVLFSDSLFGQSTVFLDKVGVSARQSANMGFVPLFMVSKSEVQSPLDMAAADLDNNIQDYKIKLPNNDKNAWLYGWLFQEHNTSGYIPNNILFLTKNERIITPNGPARIFIMDRNHDLDFTNDNVDTIWDSNPNKLISYFEDSIVSTGITIENFPHNHFWKFSNMIDLFISESKGKRLFVGAKFSLKVKRYQLRYSQFKIGNQELVLGVYDKNNNGRIDDVGVDEVFIAQDINKTGEFDLRSSVGFNKEMVLTWLGNAYLVKYNLSKKVFSVSKAEVNCSESTLMVGQKIPRVKYCVAKKEGGRRSVRKVKENNGKVILVWSAFDSTFSKDSASWHNAIRLSLKNKENIEWVMLNYGGAVKYLSRYNSTYDLPKNCKQGVLSPFEVEKLKLQVMPQWFILDNRNVIQKIGKGYNEYHQYQDELN